MDNQNGVFVNAIMKVEPNFDDSKLTQQGIKIGTKAKDIWTAKIPLNAIHQFVKVGRHVMIEGGSMHQDMLSQMDGLLGIYQVRYTTI
jgi:hypothetical protein